SVDDDFDWNALHDLDVIAGGILRRQEREGGARSRLDAGDMAADAAVRISVNRERHRLSRPHRVELGLLEIRRDPNLVRNEHGQSRAGLRELADRGGEADNAPRFGRADRSVGKIELRGVNFGPVERYRAFVLHDQKALIVRLLLGNRITLDEV